MTSFLLSLYNHITNVFEYNKLKYDDRNIQGFALQSALHRFLFYFFLACILHAFIALYYYAQPRDLAHFSNMLLLALKFNLLLVLYFITGIFRLVGIPMLHIDYPTFMPGA